MNATTQLLTTLRSGACLKLGGRSHRFFILKNSTQLPADQAAEELRQAHAYSNSEGWENETDAKAAYDEHLAAAQALEDWEGTATCSGLSQQKCAHSTPHRFTRCRHCECSLAAACLKT